MKSNIFILTILMMLLASSCSSAPKAVPVKVYSEPAGGFVIYRVDREADKDAPWIYLGTTPVESVLYIEKKTANKANKLSIRGGKGTRFNVEKEWEGEKIKDEVEERKMLFWNPNLVQQKAK